MKAVKASRNGRPAKVQKAKVVKSKPKQEKPPKITAKVVRNLVVDTLQNCSFGEYNLPSILTQYGKGHPLAHLGLHREFYIPIVQHAVFYEKYSEGAERIFESQAGTVLLAFGEGVPIREKKFDIPLCWEDR